MQKALEEPKTTAGTASTAVARTGDKTTAPAVVRPGDVSRLSTPELVARIAQDAQDLVKAEIQLAKSELQTTVQGIGAVAKRMAIAGVLLIGAYFTLLAAAVAGLALVLETWAAALIVGGILLLTGGLFALLGTKAAPRSPLERTRRSLQEDLKLAKDQA